MNIVTRGNSLGEADRHGSCRLGSSDLAPHDESRYDRHADRQRRRDAERRAHCGALVVANSPSQTAQTTTDGAGRFSFISLGPDTYTRLRDQERVRAADAARHLGRLRPIGPRNAADAQGARDDRAHGEPRKYEPRPFRRDERRVFGQSGRTEGGASARRRGFRDAGIRRDRQRSRA